MAKKKSSKAKVIVATVATLAAGTLFWFSSQTPSYHVSRIIDGDTFETTEGLKVRLAGVNAPELKLCGGEESKEKLEKLILKKPIYLKVLYNDPFKRLVSQVYTQKIYVNAEMAKTGNAYYENHEKGLENLKTLSDIAKKNKVGIFSSRCTQTTNPKNPSCNIKGNIPRNQTKKYQYYFLPGCGHYSTTVVQLYQGDQWFCTETEAKKVGFTKANECN